MKKIVFFGSLLMTVGFVISALANEKQGHSGYSLDHLLIPVVKPYSHPFEISLPAPNLDSLLIPVVRPYTNPYEIFLPAPDLDPLLKQVVKPYSHTFEGSFLQTVTYGTRVSELAKDLSVFIRTEVSLNENTACREYYYDVLQHNSVYFVLDDIWLRLTGISMSDFLDMIELEGPGSPEVIAHQRILMNIPPENMRRYSTFMVELTANMTQEDMQEYELAFIDAKEKWFACLENGVPDPLDSK